MLDRAGHLAAGDREAVAAAHGQRRRQRPAAGAAKLDFAHDRAARIGDPRNDENLIIAQLHLAFLKAHNRLVDQGRTFAQARRVLRQHHQHIVIQDFLKRIADPAIVDHRILQQGNQVYDALAEPFFRP